MPIDSPFACTVTEIKPLTALTWSLSFEPERPIEFKPGQYINVLIPLQSGLFLNRNYSLATPPGRSPLELCFEVLGPATVYLQKLSRGDVFHARGPLGNFTFDAKPDRHLCYVATGSGIAPFRSIVLSESYQRNLPISTTCVFGRELEEEYPYREEMEIFAREVRNHFIPVSHHHVADCIESFSDHFPLLLDRNLYLNGLEGYPWRNTDFFLCGDEKMIEDVEHVLAQKNVPPSSVHSEAYFDSRSEDMREAG